MYAPPRSRVALARRDRARDLEQAGLVLDGAGPGDQRDVAAPEARAGRLDHRRLPPVPGAPEVTDLSAVENRRHAGEIGEAGREFGAFGALGVGPTMELDEFLLLAEVFALVARERAVASTAASPAGAIWRFRRRSIGGGSRWMALSRAPSSRA